jgi:hypothetical protein
LSRKEIFRKHNWKPQCDHFHWVVHFNPKQSCPCYWFGMTQFLCHSPQCSLAVWFFIHSCIFYVFPLVK